MSEKTETPANELPQNLATPGIRSLNRDGSNNVLFKDRSHSSSDWYHQLLWVSWPKFLFALLTMFISINLIFGSIYSVLGTTGFSGLSVHSPMGLFWECFFFSVQTFSTIGYGHISPVGFAQNVAVAIEALLGMISVAIIAGICFSRFSRPVARLLFSEKAIMTNYLGKPCLLFRLANARHNQIAEAQLYCVVLRDLLNDDRRFVRRQFDLALMRDRNIFFSGSWTAVHVIDEDSPIYGLDYEQMTKLNLEILVSFSGHDNIYNSGVRSRWSYQYTDILFEHEFEDMVFRRGNKILVDLKKISHVRPRDLNS